MNIQLVEESVVYENPWVTVYFDHVKCENPKISRYTRIIESNGQPGVAVLPILDDLFGFVRVFRYPIGRVLLEIPRGYGDGDNAEANARRELLEETGILECNLVELGQLYPNSGLLANYVNLFAAICTPNAASSKPNDDEVAEFKWIPRQEAMQMLASEIMDAYSLAAVLRATQRGL